MCCSDLAVELIDLRVPGGDASLEIGYLFGGSAACGGSADSENEQQNYREGNNATPQHVGWPPVVTK